MTRTVSPKSNTSRICGREGGVREYQLDGGRGGGAPPVVMTASQDSEAACTSSLITPASSGMVTTCTPRLPSPHHPSLWALPSYTCTCQALLPTSALRCPETRLSNSSHTALYIHGMRSARLGSFSHFSDFVVMGPCWGGGHLADPPTQRKQLSAEELGVFIGHLARQYLVSDYYEASAAGERWRLVALHHKASLRKASSLTFCNMAHPKAKKVFHLTCSSTKIKIKGILVQDTRAPK